MDLFGEPDAPEEDPVEEVLEDAAETEEGLSHPRLMSLSLGNNQQEAKLLEQFEAGRVNHGLIFTVPKGIGKATFAFKLARFLLSQQAADPNQDALFGGDDLPQELQGLEVDKDSPVFRQVASGGHPDLMTVERAYDATKNRSEEHTSELQSRSDLVCRLLLEKKKNTKKPEA